MTDETPQETQKETVDEVPSPELLALAADWEACLEYFHAAVHVPLSVPPWSHWWFENQERAAKVFSLVDYVRLKHRRLKGARQILQLLGRLEQEYVSPANADSCVDCGERAADGKCPQCGTELPAPGASA